MEEDSFLSQIDPEDLPVAKEFLTNWLPFLSKDLCGGCSASLRRRVESIRIPGVPEPTNRIIPTGWIQETPQTSDSISIDQIVPSGWELYPEPTNQITPPVSYPEPSSNQITPPVSYPEPSSNQITPPVSYPEPSSNQITPPVSYPEPSSNQITPPVSYPEPSSNQITPPVSYPEPSSNQITPPVSYPEPSSNQITPPVSYPEPSSNQITPPVSYPEPSSNQITPPVSYPEPSSNQITPPVSYPEPSSNQITPPVSYPEPSSNQITPPVSYPEPSSNQITPPVSYPESSRRNSPAVPYPEPSRMSWADMAQEDDELEERETEGGKGERKLSKEERILQRFRNIKRKKDYFFEEKFRGRMVNILEGLELHEGVFNSAEQKRIVNFIYELQEKGRRGELGDKTYSEPRKWMRGKGRVTIQFGCNYNYAKDKDGNPPGIMRKSSSDPIPSLFKIMIRRLVQFHVLPPNCIPDSLIVNIYEPGDCIPPHIDSHDFVRPFCTVSFLSECDILFGSGLGILGPGEFDGPFKIPLPVGSVLVLNGNGADVAKHCVPAVPTKRISITFRKMDESKWPDGFSPEPDLLNIIPLSDDASDINNNNITSIDEKGKKPEIQNGNHSRNLNESRTPEIDRSNNLGNGDLSSKRSEFQSRNSNFGVRINEVTTPDNYRRHYELERSSYERNGEVRRALSVGNNNNSSVQSRSVQGEKGVFSRVNEGIGALSVGNNGSVHSGYAHGERSRVNGGMSALSGGNNGSVRSERSVFSRMSEVTGALSSGNNGSVSPNGQSEKRSVFSRLNGGRDLSGGNNGSVHSPNGYGESSVFSRLSDGNNGWYEQRGNNNANYRFRTKNNNSYNNNNGWRNGQESI